MTGPVVQVVLQATRDVPGHDEWLSAEERAVLAQLRFTKRREDWRLGRWTAKRAVAGVLGWAPDDAGWLARIRVIAGEDGAPEVSVDGQPGGPAVSITHRGGRAACAVGPAATRLGCDLEAVEPRSRGFVTDYLTPEEVAEVDRAPDVDRAFTATLIWSAKESALKALRSGLRADTRSVVVEIGGPIPPTPTGPHWRPLSVRDRATGRAFQGWWRPLNGLVLTLVADEEFDPPGTPANPAHATRPPA